MYQTRTKEEILTFVSSILPNVTVQQWLTSNLNIVAQLINQHSYDIRSLIELFRIAANAEVDKYAYLGAEHKTVYEICHQLTTVTDNNRYNKSGDFDALALAGLLNTNEYFFQRYDFVDHATLRQRTNAAIRVYNSEDVCIPSDPAYMLTDFQRGMVGGEAHRAAVETNQAKQAA